jgi:hypothetical protein
MRTLSKNTIAVWYVNPSGYTDTKDANDDYTGERTTTFATAVKVYINMFPSNGIVAEQIFGKDASLDMVAVSNDIVFTKDTLIFTSVPVSNFPTTYDYRVSKIVKSLNTYQYGLTRRT